MIDIRKRELAERASILYYEKNFSQNEIAKAVGISRSSVSQLLSFARNTGIVEISINIDEYNPRMIRREIELKENFPHMMQFYIMSSESEEATKRNLGDFAAPYLSEMINEAEVIGVNLGASVDRAIRNLSKHYLKKSEGKKIVQIMGCFNKDIGRAHPNELVKRLGSILKCSSFYLNCPAVVEQDELRKALLKETSIDTVIKMWDQIDLAIIGIGVVNEQSKLNFLLSRSMKNRIMKSDACSEVNINFFDIHGEYIPLLKENKISASYDTLKKIKKKVAICHGEHKKEAILAALNARIIDVLITDSLTIDAIGKCNKAELKNSGEE
ncbi:MAG: sugar-binding domain-containing protein [Candidatus Theseobacter exili]|nr:sugar-binding domain-containing protein [Candidatus Theseobacter exili]